MDFVSLIVASWFALTPASPFATNTVPQAILCVATHESQGHQFTGNGNPLISPTNDVGIMQINLPTWKKTAEKMGLDILHSEADNVAMGIWIWQNYGPEQWTTYKPYCMGNNSA